jgi:hypothetical protein
MELKIFDIPYFLSRKGYTHEGLAKEIGCGTSNVGMWAKGSFPGFNKLLKLVELGMTMEEIFGTKLYKEFILPNFEKRTGEITPEMEGDFEKRVCEVLIKHLSEGAR